MNYNELSQYINYRKKLLRYLSDDSNLDNFCKILQKSVSEDRMIYHGVECDIYCHKMYNMTTKELVGLKFESFWSKSKSTTYEDDHMGFILSIHPNGMRQDFIYSEIIDKFIKIYTRDMMIDEILED